MAEVVLLILFVVFGIICYNIGKLAGESKIDKQRLENIRRVDNLVANLGKHYDRVHKKGK